MRELASRGTPSVIAGRDEAALGAAALPGEIRTFGLADPAQIAAKLEGITAVVNATGKYCTAASGPPRRTSPWGRAGI